MLPTDPTQFALVLAAASSFVLVLSLWGGWLCWWMHRRAQQEQQLRQRMHGDTEHAPGRMLRLWHDGKPAATFVPALPMSRLIARRLSDLRYQAGLESSWRSVLGMVGLIALIALLMLLLTGSVLAAAAGPIAAALVAWVLLRRRINQRRALFDQQFVDSLDLAARSLRAGHPLSGTFHLLAEEIPAPMGEFFAEICQQQALGVQFEEAMNHVAEQAHSEDMRLFATSLAIQMRSGGNLADMMERLAFVVRDRIRLNRRVKVLTAQTQLSKNVLVAMPFVIFTALSVMNPRYIATLYETPAGQKLLAVAAVLLLLGIWVMNRLAVLRY